MSNVCKESSGTYRSQHLKVSLPHYLTLGGLQKEGKLKTHWNWLKRTENAKFHCTDLREISRPALREHSAGPLSIPFACSGRHKIYSHQMKLSLGNEAGAGKTENIVWALVITLGISWWRQIRKVAWSHPGLHDASNGIKREHHKVGLEEQHTALSDDFHS